MSVRPVGNGSVLKSGAPSFRHSPVYYTAHTRKGHAHNPMLYIGKTNIYIRTLCYIIIIIVVLCVQAKCITKNHQDLFNSLFFFFYSYCNKHHTQTPPLFFSPFSYIVHIRPRVFLQTFSTGFSLFPFLCSIFFKK